MGIATGNPYYITKYIISLILIFSIPTSCLCEKKNDKNMTFTGTGNNVPGTITYTAITFCKE